MFDGAYAKFEAGHVRQLTVGRQLFFIFQSEAHASFI